MHGTPNCLGQRDESQVIPVPLESFDDGGPGSTLISVAYSSLNYKDGLAVLH